MNDSKTRFSNKADYYVKYRPGYPEKVLQFLKQQGALIETSVVADIGSGTGKLSELFLENGNRVIAVEPNDDMREVAERLFGDNPSFKSVGGSAENTSLASRSVDLVVVANALHWVDRSAARQEISRILKPGAYVAVIWSVSKKNGTPFLNSYTKLIADYKTTGKSEGTAGSVHEIAKEFFQGDTEGERSYEIGMFEYFQRLNFDGLKGLVLSGGSMPVGGDPRSTQMLHDLREMFDATESGGEVIMEYEVSIYCGRLANRGRGSLR